MKTRHCLLDVSRERRLYDRSFSYRDDYKPTKSRDNATTFCEMILEIGIAAPLLSHEVNEVNPKGVFCACRNKRPLRLSYPLASESNLLCSIKRSYVIIDAIVRDNIYGTCCSIRLNLRFLIFYLRSRERTDGYRELSLIASFGGITKRRKKKRTTRLLFEKIVSARTWKIIFERISRRIDYFRE